MISDGGDRDGAAAPPCLLFHAPGGHEGTNLQQWHRT